MSLTKVSYSMISGEYVNALDYGAVGNGIADDTTALQTAINYCIANLKNLYLPSGTYLISEPLNFIANSYATDYPFPRLNQIILSGESGSKIKAASGFTGAMLFMGDSATSTGFKDALFLIGLTIDGGNQEIKLVDALPNWQARFYAERCNFVGVTGANSYAIDSTWSSAWLKDCVLQGSGAYTSNGIGIIANVTTISLDNCFISYFAKAIYYTNFVEATVQAKNCLFQINAANLAFEGAGYTNNASTFTGCYFVESKPNDVHFKVDDEVNFGSWSNLNFYGCQFDGYNAIASTPLLDLDFGNCGSKMSFTGCSVWVASAPAGTTALQNVIIGQYSSIEFNSCSNFKVISNNNPTYAKFADWKLEGTSAGSSSAGDNTRQINTTVFNTIPGCSLATNKITLSEGVYSISASAPCYQGDAHSLQLYNVTASAVLIYGTNEYASVAGDGQTRSQVNGRIVITTPSEISLVHYITSAKATNGLGLFVGDSDPEVYAQIEIWKEA